MDQNLTQLSKFLSLILRHQPEAAGLTLDINGWADVETLLKQCALHQKPLTRLLLERIVGENDKKRFAFNDDGSKIRAVQGHSVRIELDLKPINPPEFLFHGTATRFLDSIFKDGLISGSRNHVHLSPDVETAAKVGSRHGKPVVLTVSAEEMHRQGHEFFCAENGVWLTAAVSPEFLSLEAPTA